MRPHRRCLRGLGIKEVNKIACCINADIADGYCKFGGEGALRIYILKCA